MNIGVPKEILAGETRVALVPDSVRRLISQGHEVRVQSGAGGAYFLDAAYLDAGAQIIKDATSLFHSSEMIIQVNAPGENQIKDIKKSTVWISFFKSIGVNLHSFKNWPVRMSVHYQWN